MEMIQQASVKEFDEVVEEPIRTMELTPEQFAKGAGSKKRRLVD